MRTAVKTVSWRAAGLTLALLLAIVLLAAALRFAGLDWDGGHLLHPDERRILLVVKELHWPRPWDWSLVLSPQSPLNPRFFAYGSLPIYLLRLLQTLVGPGSIYLAGRALSATCDLFTIVAIYFVGHTLGGRRTGVLAAAFLAVAVLPIQLAHYLTVESLLTLLSTLAVCALLWVSRSGSFWAGGLAGVLIGLALATKTSAVPLFLVAWAAWALWMLGRPGRPRLGRSALGFALTAVAAVLTFLLAEPYSVLDWFRFAGAIAQEGAMSSGLGDVPYARQYLGTLPYLYPLEQTVLWALGLPLGLLALAGLVWLTGRGVRQRRPADLVILAWLWPYFLVVGAFHAKFLRYMAPLIPWLCLAAASLLCWLWQRSEAHRWRRRAVAGLGGGIWALTLLYALAFVGIYERPHPWLEASAWICREVPSGATLAIELWDDPLPVHWGSAGLACKGRYRQLWLDLYAPDDEGKLDRLVAALGEADYIILASQRLYGTIGRLPERYPLTSAYYRLLFSEKLGYRLVDVRTNYPRLGPVAIVDEPLRGTALPRPALLDGLPPAPLVLSLGRADESYSVYDHPRTLIFKRERSLAPAELRALLRGASASGRW